MSAKIIGVLCRARVSNDRLSAQSGRARGIHAAPAMAKDFAP